VERAVCSRSDLNDYLRINLNPEAITGRQGLVSITFTVDLGGEIREVVPTQMTDPVLTAEVLRVFGLMQGKGLRWHPGKINGTPRAMPLTLQLSFGLRCSDCDGLDEEITINQVWEELY